MMKYIPIALLLCACSSQNDTEQAMKALIVQCEKPVKITAKFSNYGNEIVMVCDEVKKIK